MAGSDHISSLACITPPSDNPFNLLREWIGRAACLGVLQKTFTLATCSRDGKVTARSLLLRHLEDDGFVFVTDSRSLKAKQLEEVPEAAMVFLWDVENSLYQVRIEGRVARLPPERYQQIYEEEPVYCKVRAHLCHQGSPVLWQNHKERHDQLVAQWLSKENRLPMPDHYVGYKLTPHTMEFYHSLPSTIADRLLFVLDTSTKAWQVTRIAA